MDDPIAMYFSEREYKLWKDWNYSCSADFKKRFRWNKTKQLLALTTVVMKSAKDVYYGFSDNLRRDNYSPTDYERHSLGLSGYNCTSIIPTTYIALEVLETHPKIVQFRNFYDEDKKKKGKEEIDYTSHFAIVIEVPRKEKKVEYLIDPFQQVYGEIIRKTPNQWTIRGKKGYESRKRIFESVLHYSKEEFAQMLYDLRNHAKSLEVLVAGQKISSDLTVSQISCPLMIYYDDATNTISTRLYINQVGMSDKAIITRLIFDERGDLQQTVFDFYLAKGKTWDRLLEQKKVAAFTEQEIKKLKASLPKKIKLNKAQRLGPVLLDSAIKPKETKQRKDLIEIISEAYTRLTAEEQHTLKQQRAVRTLYETMEPEKEYIFSEEEREKRMFELHEKGDQLAEKASALKKRQSKINWKLEKASKKERRKIRRELNKISNNPLSKELSDLREVRYFRKEWYHRMMDMVLFAKDVEAKGIEEAAKGLNTPEDNTAMIGYAAMVADFLPYLTAVQHHLTLEEFLPGIQVRVKARRAVHKSEENSAKNI